MINNQYLQIVQLQLAKFAAQDDFLAIITTAFGDRIDLLQLQNLRQQWLNEDFSVIPDIQILASGELNKANGAYSNDLDCIFVNPDFLAQASEWAIASMLLEEVGHRIDRLLNGYMDSAGDEGEIFSLLIDGYSLSPEMIAMAKAQDDRGVIVVAGKLIAVEKQDIYGNEFGNNLLGTNDPDIIYSYAGNDIIYGNYGDDYIDGGLDNDQIYGGSGNDTLWGREGNDIIYGQEDNDIIYGNDGDDGVAAGAGNDYVDGGSGSDGLNGESGDDYLFGGLGDDDLRGGIGTDTLQGSDGDDTLWASIGDVLEGGNGNDYYRTYLNSDGLDNTIDDLSGIDTLDLFTNPVSINSFSKSDTKLLIDINGDQQPDISVLNFFSSAGLAGNGFIETFKFYISAPIMGTTLLDKFKPVRNNFGNDQKSDILWRNTNGQVYLYQMNGFGIAAESSLGVVTNDWKIAGTGDFDANSRTDILWRNDNGSVYLWKMDGINKIGEGEIRNVSIDWKIAGTGDFNADGKSDILWRNDNGEVYIYQMNGLNVANEGSVRTVSNDWKIAGTGDFNGDGKSDILWHNTNSSETYIYLMNGTAVAGEGLVRQVTNDWKIKGIDDFNNDGKSDILWRNTNSGAAYIYQMNGTSIANEGLVGSASLDWNISGTGDYNSDGNADILWRNNNGLTYAWTINGLSKLGEGSIRQVDNSWQIVAPTI
jgi:RTX calcium-binding nonapeptide repeat (4 copies)/FG-GAP-like repeat